LPLFFHSRSVSAVFSSLSFFCFFFWPPRSVSNWTDSHLGTPTTPPPSPPMSHLHRKPPLFSSPPRLECFLEDFFLPRDALQSSEARTLGFGFRPSRTNSPPLFLFFFFLVLARVLRKGRPPPLLTAQVVGHTFFFSLYDLDCLFPCAFRGFLSPNFLPFFRCGAGRTHLFFFPFFFFRFFCLTVGARWMLDFSVRPCGLRSLTIVSDRRPRPPLFSFLYRFSLTLTFEREDVVCFPPRHTSRVMSSSSLPPLFLFFFRFMGLAAARCLLTRVWQEMGFGLGGVRTRTPFFPPIFWLLVRLYHVCTLERDYALHPDRACLPSSAHQSRRHEHTVSLLPFSCI